MDLDLWSYLPSAIPCLTPSFSSSLLVAFTSSSSRLLLLPHLLVLCCLPVILGCEMVWKSSWYHHATTTIIGCKIIGLVVVGLIVTLGMTDVTGQGKKCFMAATNFVAHCVGNIVGPQLIKSERKTRYFPEFRLAFITWHILATEYQLESRALIFLQLLHHDRGGHNTLLPNSNSTK